MATHRIDNSSSSKNEWFLFLSRILPKRIGGPGSRLPRFIESFLTWAFAIGCLGVALWNYQIDRYRTKSRRRCRSRYGGITPQTTDCQQTKHRRDHGYHHRQKYLPITTHSRREWTTVSESYEGLRTRYRQLIVLIYASIHGVKTGGNQEEEEKKSMDENEYLVACGVGQVWRQEEQTSSMGEAIANWLFPDFMVTLPLGALPSKDLSNPDTTITTSNSSSSNSSNSSSISHKSKRCIDDQKDALPSNDSHATLIKIIRTNGTARRLASLLLGEDPIDTIKFASLNGSAANVTAQQIKTGKNKEKWLERLSHEEPGANALLSVLREIWPRLLELPSSLPLESNIHNNEKIQISVVVPAFREDPRKLAAKIRGSMEHASEPHRIEIIVVHVLECSPRYDAGNKHDREENSYNTQSSFAKILREKLESTASFEDNRSTGAIRFPGFPVVRVLEYGGGGGRGPCLNYGAKHATGSILVFLHGDTRLTTQGWDTELFEALQEDGGQGGTRTTCCAFTFGIDTSPEALRIQSGGCDKHESWVGCSSSRKNNNCYQQYYPPGLRAIEVTANLRCRLFSMPYGDQCLSLPTAIFRYVGGYPDQCLMEDYELVRLLRMRSVASLARPASTGLASERIELLSGNAVCSPRRWQKYGVLFVTYTNSYCVKRYSNGEITPDGLFCEYYGTSEAPIRTDGERSPWEVGL